MAWLGRFGRVAGFGGRRLGRLGFLSGGSVGRGFSDRWRFGHEFFARLRLLLFRLHRLRLGGDLHLAVGVLDHVALVYEPMQVAQHGSALGGKRRLRLWRIPLGKCLGAFRFVRLGNELVENHSAGAVLVPDNERHDITYTVTYRGLV